MGADWRRRWRALPVASQRAINRALADGAPVEDEGLAPLAVELAERRLGWIDTPRLERRIRPQRLAACAYGVLVLVWAASGITDGDRSDLAIAGIWALLAVGLLLSVERQRRRLLRAHAENSRIVEARGRYEAKQRTRRHAR